MSNYVSSNYKYSKYQNISNNLIIYLLVITVSLLQYDTIDERKETFLIITVSKSANRYRLI